MHLVSFVHGGTSMNPYNQTCMLIPFSCALILFSCRLNLSVPQDCASNSEVPQVVGSKLDTLLPLELLLCWRKKLLPMVIEGGAAIWFACPGQKQWVAVI